MAVAAQPVQVPSRRKRRRRWPKVLLSFFLMVILSVGAYAGYLYWKMERALQKITQPSLPGTSVVSVPTDSRITEKPFAVLLLGKDTRTETGSLNTDVIIVGVVNPKMHKVTLVSIPRDTKVKIPGLRAPHKANYAFAYGEWKKERALQRGEVPEVDGPTMAKETVGRLLDIPIDYYVLIDFEGFVKAVDALGGVDIEVERDLVYHDATDGTRINLKKGFQHLDGEEALGYVRHRLDDRGWRYYSNDFERNLRQQKVLRALAEKAQSIGVLTALGELLDVAGEHIRTDLTPSQMKALAWTFRSVKDEDILSLTLDGTYWDRDSGFTIIPRDTLDRVSHILQAELAGKMVTAAQKP